MSSSFLFDFLPLQPIVVVFSQPCSGLLSPRFHGFLITHNDAPQSVGLTGRVLNPQQRFLPGNRQHSQQTHILALGVIRTHNLSRRAAVDLRLRPRSYCDRYTLLMTTNCRLLYFICSLILFSYSRIITPVEECWYRRCLE